MTSRPPKLPGRRWLIACRHPEGLSWRFLAAAAVLVLLAMIALGQLVDVLLDRSIAVGVGSTAAASLDALIADELREPGAGPPFSPDRLKVLDNAFDIANNLGSTRLIEIRILGLDGKLLYASSGGLIDPNPDTKLLATAAGGEVVSDVVSVPLSPIAALPTGDLTVLKIITPLHASGSGDVFAVAALYYGAKQVIDIQQQAKFYVALATFAIGLVTILALFWLVDHARRTIASQRVRLFQNLAQSRDLARENRQLHLLSERLRRQANFSNEHLLAQVGSDLHDGPIQLLTLLILDLSKAVKAGIAAPDKTVELANEAMTELRGIVTGLMLPELDGTSLTGAIELACARHENSTGASIARQVDVADISVPSDVKICAYRIIREALMNAFRHGDPNASVVASTRGGWLALIISNAIPLEADELGVSSGIGLRSMRFRVESLGGEMSAEMLDGVATITAKIPLALA